MTATAAPRRTPARWRRTTAGELASECIGTFILICFGDGVVAMAVAALNQSGRGTLIFQASGDWLRVGPAVDQIVGTAFLVAFVFAVTDELNQPVRANLAPWIVGLIVVAIGISFGANAGYAINPARDFGPRLFAWLAGWGKIAMPGNYGNVNTYFWI